MSEPHLPECPMLDVIPFVDEGWDEGPCICDRLRACEQRVLDAAREAIRNREDGEYFPWVQVEIALAAIDALRGES